MSVIDQIKKIGDTCPFSITIAEKKDDLLLTYVNQHFITLTGYTYKEAIGKNCRFLQGKARCDEHREGFMNGLESGKPFFQDFLNYRKDGSYFINRVVVFPIEEADGSQLLLGIQNNLEHRSACDHNFINLKNAEASSEALAENIFLPFTLMLKGNYTNDISIMAHIIEYIVDLDHTDIQKQDHPNF